MFLRHIDPITTASLPYCCLMKNSLLMDGLSRAGFWLGLFYSIQRIPFPNGFLFISTFLTMSYLLKTNHYWLEFLESHLESLVLILAAMTKCLYEPDLVLFRNLPPAITMDFWMGTEQKLWRPFSQIHLLRSLAVICKIKMENIFKSNEHHFAAYNLKNLAH